MIALSLILASCLGASWRVDRVRMDCFGAPSPAAAYRVFTSTLDAIPFSCLLCCNEACSRLCESTCYSYTQGPWVQAAREMDPTPADPGPFCFDWDSGWPAGQIRPELMDVLLIWIRAESSAGILSGDCP